MTNSLSSQSCLKINLWVRFQTQNKAYLDWTEFFEFLKTWSSHGLVEDFVGRFSWTFPRVMFDWPLPTSFLITWRFLWMDLKFRSFHCKAFFKAVSWIHSTRNAVSYRKMIDYWNKKCWSLTLGEKNFLKSLALCNSF